MIDSYTVASAQVLVCIASAAACNSGADVDTAPEAATGRKPSVSNSRNARKTGPNTPRHQTTNVRAKSSTQPANQTSSKFSSVRVERNGAPANEALGHP